MANKDLQSLFSRPQRQTASTLSVYLNVDQSQQANLNRKFETQLNDIISTVHKTHTSNEGETFARAAQYIKDFVSAYQPHARGLALFFDAADGFFWHGDFDVPFRNEVRWDSEAYLQPLVNATDQLKRYVVVLADRAHVRVFTVFLRKIEASVRMHFEHDKTRHIKAAGTDHISSASRLQRKADEHIHANLKHVIPLLDLFEKTQHIDRLILAGTPEITAELRELLPKSVSSRIIGTANVAANASEADLIAATQKVADEFEHQSEVQTVNEVLTTAAKTDRAVVGLGRTLNAVNAQRVWQFIYSEGSAARGFECSQCTALFPVNKSACPYCGGRVHSIEDVVERAAQRALRNGAKIEFVTREAASSLLPAGGVGAFLKTRKAVVRG